MRTLLFKVVRILSLTSRVTRGERSAAYAATASNTVYTAEFGVAPDATELNVLIAFTTPQYAFGQQIGVLDPAAYAHESLGVALASTATLFQNTYGPTNPTYPNTAAGNAQFVSDAYTSVFGHSPTAAAAQVFINELNLLEGLYTASGAYGSPANVDLLARGGIYGLMWGMHAELDPFGPGGASGLVPLVGAATDTTHHS
jgi:hypothetical protein